MTKSQWWYFRDAVICETRFRTQWMVFRPDVLIDYGFGPQPITAMTRNPLRAFVWVLNFRLGLTEFDLSA